jgi:hypothetical protein
VKRSGDRAYARPVFVVRIACRIPNLPAAQTDPVFTSAVLPQQTAGLYESLLSDGCPCPLRSPSVLTGQRRELASPARAAVVRAHFSFTSERAVTQWQDFDLNMNMFPSY